MKAIYWLAAGFLLLMIIMRKSGGFSGLISGTGNTAQTTGTARNAPLPWFPEWTGFNAQSISATNRNVKGIFASFKDLSNTFGFNDGGSNPGVAINGSNNGGIASSGSGAGTPVDSYSDSLWSEWNFGEAYSPDTAYGVGY